MAFKQYTPPHDREMMGGDSGDAAGMGSAQNAPGPGQMEGGEGYDENAPPAPPEKEEGSAGETAMVPLALLGGKEFKPGEEVVMKVVKIDKENGMVEIAYSTGEDKPPGGMPGMAGEESPAVKAMP